MKMASLEPSLLFFIQLMIMQLVPLTAGQQQNFTGLHCLSKGMDNYKNSTYAANPNTILTSFSTTTVEYGFYYSTPVTTPARSTPLDFEVESLLFKLDAIRAASDNISSANKLRKGGCRDVFKGVLPNGQEIAVKRLALGPSQGDIEFKNEVLFLAKLQHKNLIKLIGFVLERGEKLLIYELVPNSSLDHYIFGKV